MAAEIGSANGIVATVCKHITSSNTLAGRNEGIGIDKSTDGGVVISGLQVIEPGIGIVVVAAVRGRTAYASTIFYNVFRL